MRLLLTLGTTGHKSTLVMGHQSPRSIVALRLRGPSKAELEADSNEPYNISLDSFFVARSGSEHADDAMYAEWRTILTGTRNGFDLGSLLVFSAQMASTSTSKRQALNKGGTTLSTRKEVVRKTIATIMPCLVSLLTVELARGRGLDEAGLAPTFEVCGLDAYGFQRISQPGEGSDFDQRKIHRSDPEFTLQTYNVLRAAESAADGIENTSTDPLLLNPYVSRPPSVLHMTPVSSGGADAHAPTSSDAASQSDTGINVPTSFLVENARLFMHPRTNAQKLEALRSALWGRMPGRRLEPMPLPALTQGAHRLPANIGLEQLSWAAGEPDPTLVDEDGNQVAASGQNPDNQD